MRAINEIVAERTEYLSLAREYCETYETNGTLAGATESLDEKIRRHCGQTDIARQLDLTPSPDFDGFENFPKMGDAIQDAKNYDGEWVEYVPDIWYAAKFRWFKKGPYQVSINGSTVNDFNILNDNGKLKFGFGLVGKFGTTLDDIGLKI